eukprot:CAMPEP_0176025966 /NCGR_PEP_ID=MMETSP0120_2-20121206/12712_1 /TAXON_ID=160619 /ORGANISM="Kryptoperidinium foliaceum, Strain CCMP 1326" /LENGTH=439 /DNA_ID=CAMNT_0017359157 /DNA_START=79 /DNA_END=1398 /DNA_ORIENTATION=-
MRRRGVKRAVAAAVAVASSIGVAAFSSFSPVTSKTDASRKMPFNAVPPLLSAERLDTWQKQQQGIKPGSPLDMICKDQQEFELAVGHAMDTLRTDYREILTSNPDFSIYDPNLEVIDPSGVHLHGVKNYKTAFRLLHALVGVFYCPDRSGLTFRMCFDKARQNIRIHWNAQVLPKRIFGGEKTTLHVDGISVYEISRNSGNITQHRIERLVINDNTIAPENGVFAALRGVAVNSEVEGIPAFNMDFPVGLDDDVTKDPFVLPFQNFVPSSRSVLFSRSKDDDLTSSSQLTAMESSSFEANIDWDALEKKNLARKKFGLKPLTPEEFLDLQEQVRELDSQQQQRAAAAAAEMAEKKNKKDDQGFFKKLFGGVLEDTCESNYDCQRPEVCCDFGFKKMCCSSGMRILDGPPRSRQGQLAEVPVIANPGPNPPGYERGGGYY